MLTGKSSISACGQEFLIRVSRECNRFLNRELTQGFKRSDRKKQHLIVMHRGAPLFLIELQMSFIHFIHFLIKNWHIVMRITISCSSAFTKQS